MQDIIKAVVLGIIQGLTEFLPISSTAHLRILPSFFGWKDLGAAYTAVIQIGTMLAIIIYFRTDLMHMVTSSIRSLREKNFMGLSDTRLLILVIIGTIPIMILGYLLKDVIRHQFRNMYVMAGSMIFFSLMFYVAEKYSKMTNKIENLGIKDSVIIGFFQSIALIPGASRSGSTMCGAFFRNLNRESAARYSFLLSIPAVLISGVYELFSERKELLSSGDSTLSLIIGTVVSGIVGYFSIWFLLEYLKKHTLMLFIVYRIIFGILIIVLLSMNIISN
jgi:undecaprenyl-diphosphatase